MVSGRLVTVANTKITLNSNFKICHFVNLELLFLEIAVLANATNSHSLSLSPNIIFEAYQHSNTKSPILGANKTILKFESLHSF